MASSSTPCVVNKAAKVKKRELMLIKDANIRDKIWKEYAKKIGCPHMYSFKIYSTA
jgi:hypothetical protein